MKSILKMISSIKLCTLEILFPNKCLGCKSKGEIICSNCILNIDRSENKTQNNIIAVFQYHNLLMKKIIWNLKYHHHKNLGLKLGGILYDELIEYIANIKMYNSGSSIIVIPVPISKIKKRKRGYNQAEMIAKGFCNKNNKDLSLQINVVYKKIETTPQARIKNRKRRLKNIKNAFNVRNENIISGMIVIIIDDVTTTGGTLREIMKVLKKSGAKKVYGFAVAH